MEICRIKEVFKNVTFQDEGHKYFYKGKEIIDSISTTGLIHKYSPEFDKSRFSQEKLDEWQEENLYSQYKGNYIHMYSQCMWKNEIYKIPYEDVPPNFVDRLKREMEVLKKQALNFYEDYKDKLELIQDELLLYDEEYNVFGAIDLLFKNKITGGVVLGDIKSNKELKDYTYISKSTQKKINQKMLIPLQNLVNCNLNDYYLQLGIYKHIFEKNTQLEMEEPFIVHFDVTKENYTIIEPKCLIDEVKKILNIRRTKIMSKIMMIIGEGGSGKTSSLRNLKPTEHFYIDCDKKGLNYKGWKDDYVEKKNYYKTNDGDTILKLLKTISETKEDIKYITIDTINSVMIADEMKRAKDKNYDKWTDLASCIYNIIDYATNLRDDLTVIFIGHTQTEEDGFVRLLTNGKKLNKIGLEKYFNTVLLSKALDGKYVFETRANNSTARTPMGAFEDLEIDNDIIKILEVLKEY